MYNNRVFSRFVELEKCIIVIKNVPTDVCEKCGQKSYTDNVAKQIEKIINSTRNAITEVAVVNYSENLVA
jgi:YgiT-type zinc finger domain-containing protein